VRSEDDFVVRHERLLSPAGGRTKPSRAGAVTRARGGQASIDAVGERSVLYEFARRSSCASRAARPLPGERSECEPKSRCVARPCEAITREAERAQPSGPPRPAQPASGGPPARAACEHAGPYRAVSRRGSPKALAGRAGREEPDVRAAHVRARHPRRAPVRRRRRVSEALTPDIGSEKRGTAVRITRTAVFRFPLG
jgi:hypothetical protein